MRQLMISLDKKILDFNSAAAKRMIDYGEKMELFIIIPHVLPQNIQLSPRVNVYSVSGSKIQQFFKLINLGKKLIVKKTITQVTTQDPFFTGLIGFWLKRLTRVKLQVQLHGDFFDSPYYRQGSPGNRLKYYLARFIVKRADSLRAAGNRIKDSLLALGIKQNKIEVRPVAVNIQEIANYIPKFNLHQKFPEAKKIFLVLGRLDKVKNLAWLINLFAEVVKQAPNNFLLIVGSGKLRSELQNKINRLNLRIKNIRLESETNDPYSYIKTADCLLFPSLSEGYGLVAIEAAAAGTPIIMNDVGVANYELFSNERVKILQIDNKKEWLDAILNI